MRWQVHSRRQAWSSNWVEVWVDQVEPPGREPFDHHVVRMPKPSVSALVVDDHDQVLLLWRHRFITDAWGWEIPAGWAEPGEDLAAAALREVEEETGWRATTCEPLLTYNVVAGISDMTMHAYLATDAIHIGPPADPTEATRIEWVPYGNVLELARKGELLDGPSLTLLCYYLASR